MAVNLRAPDPAALLTVAGVELGVARAGIRKPGRRDLLVVRVAPGAVVLVYSPETASAPRRWSLPRRICVIRCGRSS
jgi:N-acetylglutamate synthase/N-acetylornithine aminotransferase